jgi:DNA-binding transcriptional regulator YiaG
MSGIDVKKLRERLGLTQADLAHQVGVAVTTLCRWENGHTEPSRLAIEKLKEIAKGYKGGR